MKTLLAKAIALASEKHMGQFDKGGMPYILHPLKVMHYTKTDDLEVMMIAVMHDVVEDTDVTFNDLSEMGFTKRVVDALRLLTKYRGQTHREYVDGIKTNKDAILVKLADLRHNSDIRRLKGITEKDTARLRKYNEMYLELKDTIKGL
jgi:(p)ppGpp synthase/HD superfamily hydrolase